MSYCSGILDYILDFFIKRKPTYINFLFLNYQINRGLFHYSGILLPIGEQFILRKIWAWARPSLPGHIYLTQTRHRNTVSTSKFLSTYYNSWHVHVGVWRVKMERLCWTWKGKGKRNGRTMTKGTGEIHERSSTSERNKATVREGLRSRRWDSAGVMMRKSRGNLVAEGKLVEDEVETV